VLRYGSLRGLVLSAVIVLADGTIVDTGRPLRKDNTGYSLPGLLLGAEGTLGFVTRVGMSVARRPASVICATLSLSSFENVPKLLRLARGMLGETLSAFEYYDRYV
jgi:FAD/FMN-containing dehydrogenase